MIYRGSSASSMIIAWGLFGQAAITSAAERPCREDTDKFCQDVKAAGARIAECLQNHREELSPECKVRGQEVHEHVQGTQES